MRFFIQNCNIRKFNRVKTDTLLKIQKLVKFWYSQSNWWTTFLRIIQVENYYANSRHLLTNENQRAQYSENITKSILQLIT